MGGGFILTPILNAMGMPIIYAIGTSLLFTVGVSLTAGRGHFRHGNCCLKTIGLVASFTVIGVTVAYQIVQWLALKGSVELYVGLVYIVMLLATSLFVYRRSTGAAPAHSRPLIAVRPFLVLAENTPVSLWNFALVGLTVGFMQGFLGVGGGFILVPLLMGVLGQDPHAAVGNSLGILFVSSIYAAAMYAFHSNVDYLVAGILMISAYYGSFYGFEGCKPVQGENSDPLFFDAAFSERGRHDCQTAGFSKNQPELLHSDYGALCRVYVVPRQERGRRRALSDAGIIRTVVAEKNIKGGIGHDLHW